VTSTGKAARSPEARPPWRSSRRAAARGPHHTGDGPRTSCPARDAGGGRRPGFVATARDARDSLRSSYPRAPFDPTVGRLRGCLDALIAGAFVPLALAGWGDVDVAVGVGWFCLRAASPRRRSPWRFRGRSNVLERTPRLAPARWPQCFRTSSPSRSTSRSRRRSRLDPLVVPPRPDSRPGARPHGGGRRTSVDSPAPATSHVITESSSTSRRPSARHVPRQGSARSAPGRAAGGRYADRWCAAGRADRLDKVGNRPAAPAADLVAKQAQAAGVAAAYPRPSRPRRDSLRSSRATAPPRPCSDRRRAARQAPRGPGRRLVQIAHRDSAVAAKAAAVPG
jgi:hypothetical protein